MPDRESTYQKFGPLLLEAIILVLLEQINELRHNQGMPEITEQELVDSLNNHLSTLAPYNWMSQY